MQCVDKSIDVQRFDDQECCEMMQFNEVVDSQSLGGAEVDMQIEGTAESLQHFLDAILCSNDQQSQPQRQSQQQPATAMAIGMHGTILISHDHESPRDENFVGGSDGKR